jgi:hypothetical protein
MKLGLFYDYHEGLAFEAELGVTVGPPRWGRPGGPPRWGRRSVRASHCQALSISPASLL